MLSFFIVKSTYRFCDIINIAILSLPLLLNPHGMLFAWKNGCLALFLLNTGNIDTRRLVLEHTASFFMC